MRSKDRIRSLTLFLHLRSDIDCSRLMLKPSDSVPSIHLPVTLPHRFGFVFTKVCPFDWVQRSTRKWSLSGPNRWPLKKDPRFRQTMYHNLNTELNKHIAQLLDVPLSTITDYFPSKLEFNTALWHYSPVAPENMSAERDGFIDGIHEHRPRKFPDLSDSVPPRSTGAKSHGRMDQRSNG